MNHAPKTSGGLVIGSSGPVPGVALHRARYDASGMVTIERSMPLVEPSYAAFDERHGMLHAVLEEDTGRVASIPLYLDAQVAEASSGGALPCHLAVHPDAPYVFVANYGDGVLSVLPTGEDGRITASEPVQAIGHESGSHAHMAAISPDGRFVLCTDLGADAVHVYAFDPSTGRLTAHGTTRVPDGRGPRHLAFHPSGRHAYLVNELSCTLIVCAWDVESGRLEPGAELPTRGDAASPVANFSAAVRVAPDGRHVYSTDRGDDTIAVHAVLDGGAALEPVEIVSCGGDWPRDIALTSDGRLLFCANQRSHTVTSFRREPESGRLTPAAAPLNVPAPSSLLPL
ncbi:lactonase family protein [Actinomadura rupiterrae]|uniref:lactonase family protein n=1 Tax=Actinomadura rupiterrae TaxID=559627 RepID=UPI0020A429CD|nr:lactonase family protein [Actinomadura rupiterrae]MCP2341744.1 6-phosphogluconolactonase (cycloisomerase 2 family) [Actinomadura rupiterrae]